MDLSLDHPGNYLYVRRLDAHGITVNDRLLRQSFLLAPDRVVEPWPVDTVDGLGDEGVEAILALQPELVLLGTGERQAFPAPAMLARFLQRGVGIEVMDNAAAARTYGLLVGEGRRVVAAFIQPPRQA